MEIRMRLCVCSVSYSLCFAASSPSSGEDGTHHGSALGKFPSLKMMAEDTPQWSNLLKRKPGMKSHVLAVVSSEKESFIYVRNSSCGKLIGHHVALGMTCL